MIIDDIRFTNETHQKYGTTIWESENCILKIEDFKAEGKRHSLSEEVEIIKHLNQLECICVPKLIKAGTVQGKEYYIVEKINNKKNLDRADVLFAFLELKGCGYIHGDLNFERRLFRNKPGNVLFNGLHCVLIDYDQSIHDDQIAKLKIYELPGYLGEKYNDWSQQCGDIEEQLKRFKYKKYFKNNKLDLSRTTLIKKGRSTDFADGVYHSIDESTVFVKGERNLDSRQNILGNIEFQGERILDVGCNTGLITRYLARRDVKIVDGIEYCREHALAGQMINHCESIFNATIKWHDLSTMPIKKEYDTILLFSVLHHIQNMDYAVNQISNNCKRILIECRLKEDGYMFLDNKWVQTNKWEFKKFEDLTTYLEKLFGFTFNRDYGQVDRDRRILEFIKK